MTKAACTMVKDRGYEALGVFQDLEHSGVAYTRADVEARQRTVLDWYADWRAAEKRDRMSAYLVEAPARCGSMRCVRRPSS